MHECSEEVLDAAFPNGWHEIGEDVYSELQYTPATFKVLEHHVKSYGGNHDGDTVINFTLCQDNRIKALLLINYLVMTFTYNHKKNNYNIKHHGLSFELASRSIP